MLEEMKSPGTTSEERLCAEARGCAAGLAPRNLLFPTWLPGTAQRFTTAGDRSSMTAFGAVLWIKKLFPWPLWGFSHWE